MKTAVALSEHVGLIKSPFPETTCLWYVRPRHQGSRAHHQNSRAQSSTPRTFALRFSFLFNLSGLDVLQLHRELLLLDLHALSRLLSQCVVLKLQSKDLSFGMAQLHLEIAVFVQLLANVIGFHVELALKILDMVRLDQALLFIGLRLGNLISPMTLASVFEVALELLVLLFDADGAITLFGELAGTSLLIGGGGLLVLPGQTLGFDILLLHSLMQNEELLLGGLGKDTFLLGYHLLPRDAVLVGDGEGIGLTLFALIVALFDGEVGLFIKALSLEPVVEVLRMSWLGRVVSGELA
ncbi:hypothetical protein PG997_014625 [Apiospora hydei]|uniref:Uncharacterized protein n=1 Tax=Apiospora hydei TaxID=1337664 RepID=A0ABR1UUC0_9PEZI